MVSILVGAALMLWALPGNAGANAGHQSPPSTVELGDNATCGDLAPEGATWIELKVDPVEDGTFTDDTLTVTIDVTDTNDGPVFSWTSNIGVDAVFVKGGPGGLLYLYDPPAESTGDTGLHAPVNPANGKFYGLSHLSFCYDVDQPTTTSTTQAPTTSTTQATTTSTTQAPTTSTTQAPTTSTTQAPTTSTTQAPTTSTTQAPTTSTTQAPTTSTTQAPTTSTTQAPTTPTTQKPTTTAEASTTTVLGSSTSTTSIVPSRVGQLPRTGNGTGILLTVAGLALLLGGAALLGSARLSQKRMA
jgi:LPXTG-motif cell wall-anchored protein